MKELYVFCEGQTEQGFCKRVLERHLLQFDCCIRPNKIAHSRRHGTVHRGGIGKYETLRFDIQSTTKSRKQNQGVLEARVGAPAGHHEAGLTVGRLVGQCSLWRARPSL